jgi:hypothetical protein
VYLWVQTTLEGYINEFVSNNHQSFLEVKAIFKEGAQGILLREIPSWIKILLV